MTKINTGVKIRLVLMGRAVWEVLAVADDSGHSVRDGLQAADPSDTAAEQMLATLETDVPLNGPPRNKRKCRDLGDEIYEFKEPGLRVLWFYDTGEPVRRRRIICTHGSPKVNKKKFQQEKAKAIRIRRAYVAAKATGRLIEPKELEG